METTTLLVMLIALVAVTYLFRSVFSLVKLSADVDYVNMIIGLVGACIAVAGIQSGLKPDYAASLAIVGIAILLYSAFDARDSIRDAQHELLSQRQSPGESH